MAFCRSLTKRATLIARAQNPSFGYIIQDHDHKHHFPDETQSRSNIFGFIQSRSFGSSLNSSYGLGGFFPGQRVSHFSLGPSLGSAFCRYMSTTIGEGADKMELMSDVAEVFTDTTVQAIADQAAAVNEVGFHRLITILIRTATIPPLINQLKSTTKLSLMRPRLEEIREEMQDKGLDPMAVADGQKRMKNLFKEYGVTPFTPLKGLFIQGPVFISFFLAVSNMAEKVPSFKNGGAFWFIDLTTPDSFYILPILTGLSFLITVECHMQEGLEGNPAAGTMKNVSRAFALISVPLTMSFPKAIFCYWITSNFFSLVYGLVIKVPGVKKTLGIPEVPVAPPTTDPKPAFSLFSAIKEASEAKAARQASTSVTVEQPKSAEQKISSSAVLSQRIRSLEKQVKGRKNNKKR